MNTEITTQTIQRTKETEGTKETEKFVRPLYLDCNGSTPAEEQIVQHYCRLATEPRYWGNLSAPHARAGRAALAEARAALAAVVGAQAQGVIFCASATEANNLAILGLRDHGQRTGHRHIVTTAIEHASVLAPCQFLAEQGFALTQVAPEADGRVRVQAIASALRPETLLVCCMQANHETGAIQAVAELAEQLRRCGSQAHLHVDAVQGLAHIDNTSPQAQLTHPRIDSIAISGHKLYGLCGIAALLLKQRAPTKRAGRSAATSKTGDWPPLAAQLLGGAQQGQCVLQGQQGKRGLRSGSVPLALALSLAQAVELAEQERRWRRQRNLEFRRHFLRLLEPLQPQIHGEPSASGVPCHTLPHVCNLALPAIDAESALLNLRSLLVGGRGSACASGQAGSAVLAAMGQSLQEQGRSLRFSWCHRTPQFWRSKQGQEWGQQVQHRLLRLRS